MRNDFRVLSFAVESPSWADRFAAAYKAGDYEGVYLRVRKGLKIAGLDPLRLIPELQYVEVNGEVEDDSAVFSLGAVRELILLTRSQAAIPRIVATGLVRLGIDDRPGKENVASLSSLRSLAIWSWRDSDLRFLSGARRLVALHIEGNGQVISLQGIQACASLQKIEIDAMRVVSLRPLADLPSLRRIWVIGQPQIAGDVTLDLEDIARLEQLEELRLTFAGSVRSVQPLKMMTHLHDIRLRGTPIRDGDESLLRDRAQRATVVLPGD